MYILVGSRIFCGKFLAYAVSYVPNVFGITVCFVFQTYIPVVMIDELCRQVLRYPSTLWTCLGLSLCLKYSDDHRVSSILGGFHIFSICRTY